MPLIIILAIVCLIKYLDVSFMQEVSWWYIIGFAFFVFLWFEFFERMLGLDKTKDDLHHEKMRIERQKRNKDVHKRK